MCLPLVISVSHILLNWKEVRRVGQNQVKGDSERKLKKKRKVAVKY